MIVHRTLSLFLFLLCLSGTATAKPKKIQLSVTALPIEQVVDTLSYMSGIPVQTTGVLSGEIQNWTISGDGIEAFEALGEAGNLFVAYDGSRVLIAPSSAVKTSVFDARGRHWPDIQSAIRSLFPRYPENTMTYDKVSETVIVRGPDGFSDAIGDVISRLTNRTITVNRGGQSEVVDLGSSN